MGTETHSHDITTYVFYYIQRVKLNNPLMGTETYLILILCYILQSHTLLN